MKRTASPLQSARTEENLREFSERLAGLDNPADVRRLLDEILTPRERSDLASRWCLMKLLLSGRTQRSIAHELRLSLCKITRGSRELKRPDSICKKLLQDNPSP